jgi:hypothetical protein
VGPAVNSHFFLREKSWWVSRMGGDKKKMPLAENSFRQKEGPFRARWLSPSTSGRPDYHIYPHSCRICQEESNEITCPPSPLTPSRKVSCYPCARFIPEICPPQAVGHQPACVICGVSSLSGKLVDLLNQRLQLTQSRFLCPRLHDNLQSLGVSCPVLVEPTLVLAPVWKKGQNYLFSGSHACRCRFHQTHCRQVRNVPGQRPG